MRLSKLVTFIAAILVFVSLSLAADHPKNTTASPMLRVGPQAVSTDAGGTNYGLFTCQVGLSSVTCYDPYQVRHAYNIDKLINSGITGRGKTIVIIDAFSNPYLIGDLNYFNAFYGLPSLNGLGGASDPNLGTFSIVQPDGPPAFNVGWAEEITLDVEWAHAIAPGANIVLVEAKTNQNSDILSATKYAVDHNLGDVITQSFGSNDACNDPDLLAQQHEVFAQATMKNITIFASAGDDGAAMRACDGVNTYTRSTSSPASDPLVTAVGGTELHATGYCLTSLGCDPSTNPPAGTYVGEIVWNEESLGGGATGGGFSTVFDEPPYQKGTIHPGKQLGVPDVSYNAATYHGVLVRLFGSWYLFGGTSSGSPQWAAIAALADEQAGHNLGFINSALYKLGQSQKKYAANFYDITSGNNSWAGIAGYGAGPGWDATTGLGSPITDQITTSLIQFVSAGDGTAAVATTKPHSNAKANKNGTVEAH